MNSQIRISEVTWPQKKDEKTRMISADGVVKPSVLAWRVLHHKP